MQRAKRLLLMLQGFTGFEAAAIRDLLPPLIAELEQWRQVTVDVLDMGTPAELADYLAISGLSISLGNYGEWGCETLECLFAELGIEPGDDLQSACEHVLAVSGDKK